jgi:hypothetical protein
MSDQDNGYPKSWKFGTDDPLEVEGRYVSTTTAPSGYGEVAIINLDVEGETRAVWLSTMVLKAQFADELRRRGSRDFNQGERITIARSAEKRTSEAGKPYWAYVTRFLDAPHADAASVLGVDTNEVDDEIPY